MSAYTTKTTTGVGFHLGCLLYVEDNKLVTFDEPSLTKQNYGWVRERETDLLHKDEIVVYLGEVVDYVTGDGSRTPYVKVLASQGVVWTPAFGLRT